MNIAVINIRDLIKYLCFFVILVSVLITGIVIIKNTSFSYCLEMQIPLMSEDKEEKTESQKGLNATYKILGTQLAMMNNINEDTKEEIAEENKINEESNIENIENKEETQDKTISEEEKPETKVIEENNIVASYTNANNDIQVKNQSSYDVNELLANSNYELKNKDKVVIYHTHTCESYTSSEKYQYQMTGAYRTTDLKYTVAKVRR